ncbi:MAG TPA: helix-turn-helix transcriptional regulator [Anaerolineae bacterium]|nr:helix-turn-helix transcriptional regulator [Anaerolineae bacterium]
MAKVAEPEEVTARRQLLGGIMQGARAKLGKSKQDCAQAMGVTAGIYTAYEEGRRDITLPELELLAYYLKVPVRLFFERAERLLANDPPIPAEKVIALRQRIIGALLRQARQDKGRSVKELAARLGVTTRRISDYELGRKSVPLAQLQEAADMLGVPMSYFIDEGIGPIGEQELLRSQFDKFSELPDDVRKFVVNPTNISYLRVAQHLSDMTTEQLRNLAASILDITY